MHCECGCGETTTLYLRSCGKYRKGEYARFVLGHHNRVRDYKTRSTLTPDQVERIKLRITQGITQAQLAGMYGVTRGCIAAISRGQSWPEVPWPKGYSGPPRRKRVPPNPSGKCHCGCGRTTSIATISNKGDGRVAGEHVRFIRGHAGWGHQKRTKKFILQ